MNEAEPTVVVVMSRCLRRGEPFGIRFEASSEGKEWAATWAFDVSEAAGKREGYDRQRITGSFVAFEGYPGCPYCKNHGYVKCGKCGRLCCYDGSATRTKCTWCGYAADVGGIIDDLDSGNDR